MAGERTANRRRGDVFPFIAGWGRYFSMNPPIACAKLMNGLDFELGEHRSLGCDDIGRTFRLCK
jgi:hypothetical protein